jgi:hypothetical protein
MGEVALLLIGMGVGLTSGVMIGSCLYRVRSGAPEWSLETTDKLLFGLLLVAAFAFGNLIALLLFST